MIRTCCLMLLFYFIANQSLSAQPAKPDSQPQNVILILADDLGYADLSCYGSKTIRTPNLDALARRGTRFTNFTVAQAVCTASRAALLTGYYPNRISMAGALNHTSRNGLHPQEKTMAEVAKANGYATAIFGKWHLGTRPEFLPTRRGFDSWLGIPYSNDNGPLHPTIRGIPPLPWYKDDAIVQTDPDQGLFTRQLTDAALDFLANQKHQPFFVYLPYVMPHVPIFVSNEFRGRSPHGLYADVVEELDANIGRLIKYLEQEKLEEKTLILFLSDNGPFLSYGNHAGSSGLFREGKLTTFEGGVRVPCIAVQPGRIPADKVSDKAWNGIDMLPTVGAWLSWRDIPKGLDGENHAGLLSGEVNAPGRQKFAYYAGDELHAVREGPWKLHLPHEYITVDGPAGKDGKPANYANMKPKNIEESGIRGIASRHGYRVEKLSLSLYQLERDPAEQKDCSRYELKVVERLLAQAAEYRKDLGDSLTGIKGAGVRPAAWAEK